MRGKMQSGGVNNDDLGLQVGWSETAWVQNRHGELSKTFFLNDVWRMKCIKM